MLNARFIVGIVILVLLGGGVAYYFLNGSSGTNTPAPVTKGGGLTTELARQTVLEQLKAQSGNEELRDVAITGISMQGDSVAMVSATIEYVAVPSVKLELLLSLYDDGWRIATVGPRL